MTYIYSAVVQSNFTANTDSLAIEITAPANVTVKIRKIRITHDDGTAWVTSDYYRKVKIVTESVAGTGGASYTPIPVDANNPAAASTVQINTGSFAVGTISATVDINSIHSTTDFSWQAEDEDDKIVVTPGGVFGVIVNPAH
jgi:hypothetical protein